MNIAKKRISKTVKMAVINLTKDFFTVSDNIKDIFSKETLMPIGLVLTLVTTVFFYASDRALVINRIAALEKENAALKVQLTTIQQSTITKEIFQLKMENFETKINQVLALLEKKK